MLLKVNKKLIILAVILVVGLAGSRYLSQQSKNNQKGVLEQDGSKVKLVSPQEFTELIQDRDAFVLDVHTPEQTHIPGTDAFISYDQIKENIDQLPEDKSIPILVYCRSGSMSTQASAEIVELGYTNVYDLDGGTNAYKEQQVSVFLWPLQQALGTVIYGDVATTSFTLTN